MKKIDSGQTNITTRLWKSSIIVGAAMLASAGMICTTVRPLRAQDQAAVSADTTKKISLTVTNAPIQNVLKTLFGSEGINYSIDQDVHGRVTVAFNNVDFETALHALLRSTNPELTYDGTGNIIHVKVKRQLKTTARHTTNNVNTYAPTGDKTYQLFRIPIDRYDAWEVAAILGAKPEKGGPTVISVGPNYVVGGKGNGGSGNRGGVGNIGSGNRGGVGSTGIGNRSSG